MTSLRPLRTSLVAGVLLAGLPGLALAQSAGTGSTPVPPREMVSGAGTSDAAKAFGEAASRSDSFEIQTSKLAVEKATKPAVKAFANRMIDDHETTTSQLKILMSTSNMPMSAPDLDAKQKAALDRLKGLSGAEFDKAYMDGQTESHAEALALMEGYAKDGDEPKLKAFAQKTASVVRGHLEQAHGTH